MTKTKKISFEDAHRDAIMTRMLEIADEYGARVAYEVAATQNYSAFEQYVKENPLSPSAVYWLMQIVQEHYASFSGRQAAISRHSQLGGSHDKQEQIRQCWASGQYRSRSECAEKEHARIGMSLDTARKALRNTPKPEKRAATRND